MMSSLASDEVWIYISWKGTDTKESFGRRYAAIQKLITDICNETFPENTNLYFEGKIKSFLRHTQERINRKQSSSSKTRT